MWPRQDGAAYKSYVDKLTRFSLWLLDQNYDVELFTTDVGVDRYAIDDLKNRVVGSTSSALSCRVTCRAASSLEELLFQMSRFDVVVTCKFHGVVFSHLLEKPVVALSYMPKIDYLMRAVGQGRYCLDIEHFDVKALIAAFESLVCNANDLTCVSRQAAATYRVKLQAEFDNLCFNG
jgi:polysaccharide pyruvyl transferase WcaK-like protein